MDNDVIIASSHYVTPHSISASAIFPRYTATIRYDHPAHRASIPHDIFISVQHLISFTCATRTIAIQLLLTVQDIYNSVYLLDEYMAFSGGA